MTVIGFPRLDAPQSYTATILTAGAVTAQSQNALAAYAFIRFFMDLDADSLFGLGVNRGITMNRLEDFLPYREELLDILDHIVSAEMYLPILVQIAGADAVYDLDYQCGGEFHLVMDRLYQDMENYFADTTWLGLRAPEDA